MAIVRRNRGEGREMARGREDLFWDPFRMMESLFRMDPFRLSEGLTRTEEFFPSFDLKESKEAYVVKADLPGIKEENLDISLTGNMLQISGHREQETQDEGDRYYAVERRYGNFSRAFTLPEGVDVENVQAELKNGVLTVHIPKKPEVQPKRIELKKGSGQNEAKA